MSIVAINSRIEEFVEKHDLVEDSAAFKKECAIGTSKDWQAVLDELSDDSKILRIGIIGRVKAGKSSMLNSLLFEGKDVLPKAATPMTAALTIIKYSTNIRAEVDFFSQHDIDEMEVRYNSYISKLASLKGKFLVDFRERALRKKKKESASGGLIGGKRVELTKEEEQKCKERADRQAKQEMKNDVYYASFDQFSRIKSSKLAVGELEKHSLIEADSVESLLGGTLNKFVGSSGEYMPFTKSVTLHIPYPGLEGIEIVDTPGINDPVTSREERTEQLLKHCDVVLVVSPSGQFLSAEDTDLLQRITTKEGTQEAYLIASQVDNQLFGSEKGASTDPVEVLGRVTHTLTNHAKNVLERLAMQYPEMEVTANKLASNDVICLSSVSYSMAKTYDKQRAWDSNLKHVFDNLKSEYPISFSDAGLAENTLMQLANIERLHDILEEVKGRKSEILQQRRLNFEADKRKSLSDYVALWENRIDEQVNSIENSDVKDLHAQMNVLSNKKTLVRTKVSEIYDDLIVDVSVGLDRSMKNMLKKQMQDFESKSQSAQGTQQESRQVYKGRGGFLWLSKRYETEYYEIATVKAGSVRKAIEEVRLSLEDDLCHTAIEFQKEWKKKVYSSTVGGLREVMDDGELDAGVIDRALKNILAAIPEATFEIRKELPSALKKHGTLAGTEAESFMAAADEYSIDIVKDVRSDIKSYLSITLSGLKAISLSELLTDNIENSISKLLHEIENKEISLLRYQNIKNELDSIKMDVKL